jgi:hypothetical protein
MSFTRDTFHAVSYSPLFPIITLRYLIWTLLEDVHLLLMYCSLMKNYELLVASKRSIA